MGFPGRERGEGGGGRGIVGVDRVSRFRWDYSEGLGRGTRVLCLRFLSSKG